MVHFFTLENNPSIVASGGIERDLKRLSPFDNASLKANYHLHCVSLHMGKLDIKLLHVHAY